MRCLDMLVENVPYHRNVETNANDEVLPQEGQVFAEYDNVSKCLLGNYYISEVCYEGEHPRLYCFGLAAFDNSAKTCALRSDQFVTFDYSEADASWSANFIDWSGPQTQ